MGRRGVMTAREQRRKQQREDDARFREERRAAYRALSPAEKARMKTVQDAKARIERNGITLEDMKANYHLGWGDGYKAAGEQVVRSCYAAICLALNELHGFGEKRCLAVLRNIDEKIMYSLDSAEAIQQVYDRMGLELDFTTPFGGERINEKNEV